YERAVEIDPNYAAAREALRTLQRPSRAMEPSSPSLGSLNAPREGLHVVDSLGLLAAAGCPPASPRDRSARGYGPRAGRRTPVTPTSTSRLRRKTCRTWE